MNKWFLILIASSVIFEVIADILFKYWTIQAKQFLLIGGILLYTISTVVWAYSLKYEYLSKAITIFTVLNLIIVVLAGIFLFKEDLTLINKVGISLGIISVILLQL